MVDLLPLDQPPSPEKIALGVAIVLLLLLIVYLVRLNQLLLSTPDEIKKVVQEPWTKGVLLETYQRLEKNPITTSSYADRIPPKLDRRYIITGGSGENAFA